MELATLEATTVVFPSLHTRRCSAALFECFIGAFHSATLVSRQVLPFTWAGLSPAGSRQLCLAHRYSFTVVDLHSYSLPVCAGAPKFELWHAGLAARPRSPRFRFNGGAGAGRKLGQFRQYAQMAAVDPGVAPDQVEQQAQRGLTGSEGPGRIGGVHAAGFRSRQDVATCEVCSATMIACTSARSDRLGRSARGGAPSRASAKGTRGFAWRLDGAVQVVTDHHRQSRGASVGSACWIYSEIPRHSPISRR